ncbi:MAG: glutamine-hydrolyzing carbamoyl-phosphate synthase small subunit [Bdellovibrionales bacterium]|nr:glutamine-hydrolyzing carbamoyl-phosphate synthase small subunit [Bdellovibrionales bacterium]
MGKSGFLVLESGECFQGDWLGGEAQAGEVVFNTSHSGYSEVATDPSYFSQIVVMTSSQQGNYGHQSNFEESKIAHIKGFVCLEMQNTQRQHDWCSYLVKNQVGVLSGLDTREIVLSLREQGTQWGALLQAEDEAEATKLSTEIINKQKKANEKDWAYVVSTKEPYVLKGKLESGPKVALIDYGVKENIKRELLYRCSEIKVFPSRVSAEEVLSYNPNGILLSNGPGDPKDIQVAVDTIKNLLGKKPMFGICMGHQLLSLALGADTYKLKYGHRGSNHPVRDELVNKIYITSQNHGYSVSNETLPSDVKVTHTNLNDNTVAGIFSAKYNCFSVQFHPENRPGPEDALMLFDEFVKKLL